MDEYKKNDEKIFEKLSDNNGIDKAISNCKEMDEQNKDGRPSDRNPMTKVYEIVEGLKEYL